VRQSYTDNFREWLRTLGSESSCPCQLFALCLNFQSDTFCFGQNGATCTWRLYSRIFESRVISYGSQTATALYHKRTKTGFGKVENRAKVSKSKKARKTS
jgi:hypothetical protein